MPSGCFNHDTHQQFKTAEIIKSSWQESNESPSTCYCVESSPDREARGAQLHKLHSTPVLHLPASLHLYSIYFFFLLITIQRVYSIPASLITPQHQLIKKMAFIPVQCACASSINCWWKGRKSLMEVNPSVIGQIWDLFFISSQIWDLFQLIFLLDSFTVIEVKCHCQHEHTISKGSFT